MSERILEFQVAKQDFGVQGVKTKKTYFGVRGVKTDLVVKCVKQIVEFKVPKQILE